MRNQIRPHQKDVPANTSQLSIRSAKRDECLELSFELRSPDFHRSTNQSLNEVVTIDPWIKSAPLRLSCTPY